MERHRFDPISFVFGLLLGAIGLAFLLGRIDVGTVDLTWVWPLPLIVVGLLMLLGARRRGDEADDRTAPLEATRPVEENPPAPGDGSNEV